MKKRPRSFDRLRFQSNPPVQLDVWDRERLCVEGNCGNCQLD
jgi:hypothetical protein